MTSKRCCGTCKWFEKAPDRVMRLDECKFPLPYFLGPNVTTETAGITCPTYEAKP
jgi:hypothetical protein